MALFDTDETLSFQPSGLQSPVKNNKPTKARKPKDSPTETDSSASADSPSKADQSGRRSKVNSPNSCSGIDSPRPDAAPRSPLSSDDDQDARAAWKALKLATKKRKRPQQKPDESAAPPERRTRRRKEDFAATLDRQVRDFHLKRQQLEEAVSLKKAEMERYVNKRMMFFQAGIYPSWDQENTMADAKDEDEVKTIIDIPKELRAAGEASIDRLIERLFFGGIEPPNVKTSSFTSMKPRTCDESEIMKKGTRVKLALSDKAMIARRWMTASGLVRVKDGLPDTTNIERKVQKLFPQSYHNLQSICAITDKDRQELQNMLSRFQLPPSTLSQATNEIASASADIDSDSPGSNSAGLNSAESGADSDASEGSARRKSFDREEGAGRTHSKKTVVGATLLVMSSESESEEEPAMPAKQVAFPIDENRARQLSSHLHSSPPGSKVLEGLAGLLR